MLREERGQAYTIQPTQFSDNVPGKLSGEDLRYIAAEPVRQLYAISGAAIIGSHGTVYVPSQRKIVEETLDSWDRPKSEHPIFSTPGLPASRSLPGISFSLGTLGGETFYHFLIESLPKLALGRENLSGIDRLLVSRYIESSKAAWLKHFGFNQEVVWLQDHDHWQCEQLVFTNRLGRHFEPNPWCVQVLREFARVPSASRRSKAFWLDRSSVQNRNAAWEPAFGAQLTGVTPIDFGKMAPADTIGHCADARVLVGLHGAAFANMVFVPAGATIIELMTEPFDPFYSRLAQSCGHQHIAVRVTKNPQAQAAAVAEVNRLIAGAT